MKSLLVSVCFLLITVNTGFSQTITTGTVTTPKCAGTTFNLTYSKSGTFAAGNIFTAQLSNAAGSFTSSVNIGTLTSTLAGTIVCTIPPNTPSGTGYRVRVVSSAPARTGSVNNSNIVINTTTINGNNSVCVGSSTELLGSTPGNNYQPWTSSNTNIAGISYSGEFNHGILEGYTSGVCDIIFTDSLGCTSTMQINVYSNPVLNVSSNAPNGVCLNNYVTLTATGADSFFWNNGVQNNVPFVPQLGVSVFIQNSVTIGMGSFSAMGYSMVNGDLNNDNKTDFVIHEANWGGPHIGWQDYYTINNNTTQIGSLENVTFNRNTISGSDIPLGIGDLDNDGLNEIVTNNGVYKNFTAVFLHSFTNSTFFIKDIDNDGKNDIINGNLVYRNNSSTTSISFESPMVVGNSNILDIGDLDGDSKLDIISNNGIFRNLSTIGTFSFGLPILLPNGLSNNTQLTLSDLNNDNKIDIVIGNSDSLFVCENNSNIGSINFINSFNIDLYAISVNDGAYHQTGPGTWSPILKNILVEDLDLDGRKEIVVGSYNTGTIIVVSNNNEGTELNPSQFRFDVFNLLYNGGSSPSCLISVDLDGDGKKEIITSDHSPYFEYFSFKRDGFSPLYNLVGINSFGCKSSINVIVPIINFIPNLFINDTIKSCYNSVLLSVSDTYSSYEWNNGTTGNAINVVNSGWYKCKVSNGSCFATDSVFVDILKSHINNNDTSTCTNQSITLSVSNLDNSSISTIWSNGSTNPLITVSPISSTAFYCTISNGVSTCLDSVKIIVNTSIPSAPLAIYGSTDVCSSIASNSVSIPVRYYVRKVNNATSYNWTVPTGATIISGQGDTAINVTFNSSFVSGVISVKSINVCGSSTSSRTLTVYKRTAATPAAIQKEYSPVSIAAVTNVCGLSSSVYRIKKVTYATSYNWYFNIGSNANITHVNSPGVNDTAVIVTFLSGFRKDTLSVKSISACNSSTAKTVILNATLLPPAVTTINGKLTPCIGEVVNYSATAAAPTTTQTSIAVYRWTKPNNTTIVSAASDSSYINLQFNTGFTGGSITAKGQSACGIAGTAKSVSLQYLTPTPTSITSSTGVYNACIGTPVTYTAVLPAPTTTQRAANVYRWTKPNYTTILSASADSLSITLQFNVGYIGGSLSVKGQTACGITGTAKTQALTHSACPTGTKINPITINKNENNFNVTIYPNPTSTDFNLKVEASDIHKQVSIKIRDVEGRLLKTIYVMPQQNVSFGSDLIPGVYMLEATDGYNKKSIRAVKY